MRPGLDRYHYALLLLSCLATSCLNPNNEENYSRVHSDSGITGRPYKDIVGELQDLETKYPTMAKVVTYGQTVGGRDLTMIRIGSQKTHSNRNGVLIAGTIHGDEFLNIEDRLPRWFLENQNSPGVAKFLSSGGIIWIAPILNPDGYTARRRENNQSKDLNRDFNLKIANKVGFSQPETSGLYKTLQQELNEQNAKLSLTLDYHCCVGALLYPWGHSYTKELPAKEKEEHLKLGKIILDEFPGYRIGRAIEIVKYVAVGASDDFYHETFNATSFTFEGAKYNEKNNFAAHTQMWDNLLATKAGNVAIIPQPSESSKPKLAVLDSTSSGLTIAASGPVGTTGIAICKGKVASCSASNSLLTFSTPTQLGDRLIFKAAGALAVQSNDLFTVETIMGNSQTNGQTVVKFLSK